MSRVPLLVILGSVSALPAQDGAALLDELRTEVAARERSVRVLAWSARVVATQRVGEGKRAMADDAVRVVLEAKPFGRIHAWFEPRRLYWKDRDRLLAMVGEAVHDGRTTAMLQASETDAGTFTRWEGRVGGPSMAHELAAHAGGLVTFWPIEEGAVATCSRWLRGAKPEDLKIAGEELEVACPHPRTSTQRTTLRFRRHGKTFSLVERRDAGTGRVRTSRVLEEALAGESVWFPKRIEIDAFDGVTKTEIEIGEVKLDPVLDEHTFRIVAPTDTFFSREGQKGLLRLGKDATEIDRVVRLETADVKKPRPPTVPLPAKQ